MNEFVHLLEDDERIIRTIKPKKSPNVIGTNILAWICIILGAFLILGGIMLIKNANSYYADEEDIEIGAEMLVFGIIVIIMGLIIPIIANLKYKSYLYCITNKKVIIRTGVIGRDFRVLELGSITTVDMIVGFSDKICGNKTASILFFNASNATMYSGKTGRGEYNKNGFMHIENATEIYKEVKALIKEVKEN